MPTFIFVGIGIVGAALALAYGPGLFKKKSEYDPYAEPIGFA